MHSTIVSFLQHGHSPQLQGALSENVVFHSPVKDYRGRAEVAHILSTIRAVLESISSDHELTGNRETVTIITARYRGHRVTGVLIETTDRPGRVEDATLLLRPLSTLLDATTGMRTALQHSPLSSAA